MKLFSIIPLSLALLAAVAPVDAVFGSHRKPTKAARREARARYAAESGRRRLVMEDCQGEVPAYLKFFDQLTNKQKLAAANLGYSWQMWNNDNDPGKFDGMTWEDLANPILFPTELGSPRGTSFLQDNFENIDIDKDVYNGFYSSLFWGKLDKIEEGLNAAAAVLDFDKELWNTCYHTICTDVQALSWFDLSGDQKEAAKEFGYTCHTWEYNLGPSNVVLDECVAPFYKRQWKGLPNAQKIAAKKLKYNETIWDGLIDDPYYDTTWEVLTDYQQDLFKELGYNKFIYNDYFEYEYIALPQAVQNAVQKLLLNGQTWDNCYSNDLLGCTQMSWGSLSTEQQQAAGMIGVSCWDYGN